MSTHVGGQPGCTPLCSLNFYQWLSVGLGQEGATGNPSLPMALRVPTWRGNWMGWGAEGWGVGGLGNSPWLAPDSVPPGREGRRWQRGTRRTCQLPTWGPRRRDGTVNHGYLQTQSEPTPKLPRSIPVSPLRRAGLPDTGSLEARCVPHWKTLPSWPQSGWTDQGSTGLQELGWRPGWVLGCPPGCRAGSRWARRCGHQVAEAVPVGIRGGAGHAWSGGRCG